MSNIQIHRSDPATFRMIGYPKPIKNWRAGMKVKVPGAKYTQAFKRGWDGYTKPGSARFDKKNYQYTLKLGRGWLPAVKQSFPNVDIEYDYSPQCDLDIDQIPEALWELLRDYQKEAIEAVRKHKWGRVALATNAGKGAIIALIAVAAKPCKTLILADEVAVFDALKEEIEKWAGETPGLVESGAESPPESKIALAMVPTLRERLKGSEASLWASWLESFSVGLLDEADRATADSWQWVCDHMVNTEYRAGFSGSFPEGGSIDDFNLMGILGPTLIRVKNEELVEREISAKPLVQLVPYQCPRIPPYEWPDEKINDPNFDTDVETPSGPALRRWAYRHAVIENEERHELIKNLLHPDSPNAIIVNRLDHGKELSEYIPDSIFLSGSDSKSYRREVLNDFRNGGFQNLIATRILDRGTNLLGNAVGLIFASGEGSARQTLQRIGRGLRKGEDKEFLFLRDIMDQGNRYLEKASRKRLEVFQDENFQIDFYEDADSVQDHKED